jgi:hypothetical protein
MSDTVAKRRPMIDLEQFERRLRQPNPANRTDEDPLAELARLVGGPDDPYKSMFETQPSRAAPGVIETNDRHDDGYHDAHLRDAQPRYIETDEDPESGRYAPFEAGFGSGRDRLDLHENADLLGADDHQSDHWRYDDEALEPPAFEPEPEPRSRRPLYLMAAIIAVGIVGIGASFALKGGSAPHEVATIKAPDGPVKVQPEGGDADTPNQNASILNRTPQSAPVAVADGTEQPVDLSRMPDHAVSRSLNSGAASIVVPRSPGQGSASGQASAAAPTIAGLIEPKKVKTVSVRPDGTVLPNDSASQALAASQSSAHAAPAAAPKAAAPKSTARVAATPKPVQVADAQTGAAPAPASPVGNGAFAVQLAAPASEQEARDIQMRLIKKYGGEIPGFHPAIRKAVSGDKTVYRVRSLGLSKEDATALCQKVQSSGGNCFVARN